MSDATTGRTAEHDTPTDAGSSDARPADGPEPGDAPEPPGPDGLPFLGSTLAVARDAVGFGESLPAYGDLVSYRALGEEFVAVFDPGVVEAVLVSRNDEFHKGEFEASLGDLLAPDGLAFAEGEQWRDQRSALQPAFRPDRIRGHADAMVRCAADLADGWDDGAVVDLREATSALALRILARTLLDVDLDADRGDVVRDAARGIGDYVAAMPVRSVLPDWLPTRTERRFERRMAALDDLVAAVVAERRDGPDDHDDLLATMLDAGMDADTVRDQLVTFLFAGHETTATGLTYATWLLAGHPDSRRRLDDELAGLGDCDPGFDDLPDLAYLDAVVREALRLYPPVYDVYRQPREDTTLGGYRVPADATVQLSAYRIHRDDRYWDDPETFRPARWLDDRDRPEYAYFPFGGGPRHCIGMRFARAELRLALAAFARRVSFERVTTSLDPDMGITLDPGEVRVRVRTR